jgi:hypothetical protein
MQTLLNFSKFYPYRILLQKGAINMETFRITSMRVIRLMVFGVLVAFSLYLVVSHGDTVLAQTTGGTSLKPNVFTPYGQPMGAVDSMGNIFALAGNQIGQVDTDGTIYNVSKIVVGTVDSEGKVMNQSGTVLCTVTPDGKVYNVSGTLLGSVKDADGNLPLIGGAARLILLRRK